MAKERFVMHIEAKRGRWSGVSTTLCGLTFKVERGSYFASTTCPTCKRLHKQAKKGGKR